MQEVKVLRKEPPPQLLPSASPLQQRAAGKDGLVGGYLQPWSGHICLPWERNSGKPLWGLLSSLGLFPEGALWGLCSLPVVIELGVTAVSAGVSAGASDGGKRKEMAALGNSLHAGQLLSKQVWEELCVWLSSRTSGQLYPAFWQPQASSCAVTDSCGHWQQAISIPGMLLLLQHHLQY